MQEKESIISVRYGTDRQIYPSGDYLAEPRDAKTVTLGSDLSVRTSHSCQILIVSFKCGQTVQKYGFFSILNTICSACRS